MSINKIALAQCIIAASFSMGTGYTAYRLARTGYEHTQITTQQQDFLDAEHAVQATVGEIANATNNHTETLLDCIAKNKSTTECEEENKNKVRRALARYEVQTRNLDSIAAIDTATARLMSERGEGGEGLYFIGSIIAGIITLYAGIAVLSSAEEI